MCMCCVLPYATAKDVPVTLLLALLPEVQRLSISACLRPLLSLSVCVCAALCCCPTTTTCTVHTAHNPLLNHSHTIHYTHCKNGVSSTRSSVSSGSAALVFECWSAASILLPLTVLTAMPGCCLLCMLLSNRLFLARLPRKYRALFLPMRTALHISMWRHAAGCCGST